jgi:predicted ribosome quality control (RQC) complex YloA/Tae2 family protein
VSHFHSSITLRAIAAWLQEHIIGASLNQAFSTGKDELLLVFRISGREVCLKFNWADGFMFISFPDEAPKQGKNAIVQFKPATGLKVERISHGGFDRWFAIELETKSSLIVKAFGKQSNVLYFPPDQEVCSLHFRLHHKGDNRISRNNFATPLEFEFQTAAFTDEETFGRNFRFLPQDIVESWAKRGLFSASDNERFHLFQLLKNEIEQPTFYYQDAGNKPFFSILPVPDALFTKDIREACNGYVRAQLAWFHFKSKQQQLLVQWTAELSRLGRLLNDLQGKEKLLIERPGYRHIGDLIMANLAEIPAGCSSFRVMDYTHEKEIDVKLNAELSALKNAEHYYRKAKNENVEAEITRQRLQLTASAHLNASQLLQAVQAAVRLRDLRDIPFPLKKQQEKAGDLPFHEFEVMGYSIKVGKHAKANEILLSTYSKKNDIWLHARDVAGSHVIIRTNQGLDGLPEPVLDAAARLAAWFSKGKSQGWLPVQYTERKYVRKRKGGAPGEVLVEKEKVLVVQPGLP